jgi:transmembrane sensor
MSDVADGSMDALIERVLSGAASDIELRRLAVWRQASPSNEECFARAERLATAARSLRFTGAVGPPRPAAADIVARVHASRRETAARHRAIRWTAGGVAAAAVLVVAIGGLALRDNGGWEPAEITTGTTELATVKLADGTVVRLAPSSRLRVLAGRTREVALEGRAFFAVTKVAGQPFRVHTAGATANVLGTRFELTADENEVRLTVVEGRVSLAAAEQTVEVGAGEAGGVRGGALIQPEPIRDVAAGTPAWLGNFLAFQSTPLRDAVREIERAFDVRVILGDSALAGATLTVSFTDRPAADVMGVVCAVLAAECSWSGSAVTMTR